MQALMFPLLSLFSSFFFSSSSSFTSFFCLVSSFFCGSSDLLHGFSHLWLSPISLYDLYNAPPPLPPTKHVIHSYSAIFLFTDPQPDKLITKHLHQQLVPDYLVHWPLPFPESWRSEHTPQCAFHSCARGTPHDPTDPVARQAEQHQLETASHGTMGTPSGECQWILLRLCLDLLQAAEEGKKLFHDKLKPLMHWANLMRIEKSVKPTSHAQSLDGDITFCAFP